MEKILNIAKRLKAMAEVGLIYTEGDYDRERYEELKEISAQLMSHITNHPVPKIKQFYGEAVDYPTPKVDVRGIIVNNKNEVLLVKEKADGKWTPPGGWCEVGLTPAENIIKEVKEEVGIKVTTERLLAVYDKKCHPHPPQPYYIYKIFFYCKPVDEVTFNPDFEILDVNYFPIDNLPELSTERITKDELEETFNAITNNKSFTFFD